VSIFKGGAAMKNVIITEVLPDFNVLKDSLAKELPE
jgi:hypothetical protein